MNDENQPPSADVLHLMYEKGLIEGRAKGFRDAKEHYTTDARTGLPNYVRLMEDLELLTTSLNQGGSLPPSSHEDSKKTPRNYNPRTFSIVFGDLDGFKHLNDTEGHEVGNQVLASIGRLVNRRDTDSLYERSSSTEINGYRYGGDEIVFLLYATALEGAETFGRRLQQTFEAHKNELHDVGISVGCVEYRPDASAFELIKEADAKMYKNKEKRKSSEERQKPEDIFRALRHEIAMALC